MALTVTDRPEDVSSAYLPTTYTFTSDKSPNTISGESESITLITSLSGQGSNLAFHIATGTITLEIGDYIRIAGTPDSFYDGVYKIVSIITFGGSDIIITDGTFTQSATATGTLTKEYNNFSAVADLYLDGAFVYRQRSQRDLDDNFVIDFQRALQAFLGNDLLAIDTTTISEAVNAGKDFYIKYGEEYDVADNGIPVNTLQTLVDDSANTKYAVNATVQYIETSDFKSILSQSQDLSDYIIDTTSTDKRFLSNMPTIELGESEHLQASVIIDARAATGGQTFTVRFRQYDSTGIIQTNNTVLTTGATDQKVIHIPVGTSNISLNASTTYYTYEILFQGVLRSEIKRINVTRKCLSDFRRFYWLNPLGGIDGYTFRGLEVVDKDIERIERKRLLTTPRVLPERTWTTVRSLPSYTFSTGTGIFPNTQAKWINEITDSPLVFVQMSDDYIPVRVLNNSAKVLSEEENTSSFMLEWQFAYDQIRQRN